MAPSASSIDCSMLSTILTTTISSISDGAFEVDDVERIVEKYEAFFLGVAQLSDRLNGSPLKAAAKNVFNCTNITATKCSTQVVEAWKFCRTRLKGYQGAPCKDWNKSVVNVVHKMYTKPTLLNKKTIEDLSPKTSPTKPPSEHQLVEVGRHRVQL